MRIFLPPLFVVLLAVLLITPTNVQRDSSTVNEDFELWLAVRQDRMFWMHSWSERLSDNQTKDVASTRSRAPYVKL